jgi:transposase
MTQIEEMKKTVEEWRASGKSAEEFSRERGFPRTRLWGWSRRLRKAEEEAGGGDGMRLLPVVRQRSGEREEGGVEVELQGARIRVGAGADLRTLAAVFEALERLRRTGQGGRL